MNSGKSEQRLIKIGTWIYNPGFGRFINKNQRELFLESRLHKIFNLLFEKRNCIVTRQEVINIVWKDVQVNEESLTKGVFDLRNFFKSNEIHQIKIETIRNIGYRLVFEEDEMPLVPLGNTLWKKIFKASLYLVGAFLFIIMLIRAIRY